MQGRDVFERLYKDALTRMRRLAESQARIFQESSDNFMQVIGNVLKPLFDELAPDGLVVGEHTDMISSPKVGLTISSPTTGLSEHGSVFRVVSPHRTGEAGLKPLRVVPVGAEVQFDGELSCSRPLPGDKSRLARQSHSAGRSHPRSVPTDHGSGDRPSTAATKRIRQSGVFGSFKVEAATLPRLECRGRQLSPSRSGSPEAKNCSADAHVESHGHGSCAAASTEQQFAHPVNVPVGTLRPRSRSPPNIASTPNTLHAVEPLLAIGRISGTVSSAGSSLVPPWAQGSSASASVKRPMSSSAPGRASTSHVPAGRALRRSTGGGSMPQLVKQQQPPRLLVQSVGAAY